jgi:hypothetical protein
VPNSGITGRTLPMKVRIGSSRAGERVLDATFKTADAGSPGTVP